MTEGKLEVFLSRLTQLLKEGGAFDPDRDIPVVQFQPPDKLKEVLPLELGPTPSSDEALLSLCQDVIKYSVKTSHHHFHNQLYSGTDPYGLAGAWLTEALNTNHLNQTDLPEESTVSQSNPADHTFSKNTYMSDSPE
uniref:Uncharacterized protein n=1 Tax=Timema bartmani TaxID=61472 RepID=A0A7R9HZJ8_9NEOP|nr:unnamed protein product [Timema bartmani]